MSDRAVRGQLGDFESVAPESLFDSLMRNREGSDEMPADAPMRAQVITHETPVAEHVFEDIMAERERRRRALIWRSAPALALLFMGYFMFVENDNSNKLKIDLEKEKINKKEFNNKENSVNENKSVVINNNSINNSDLTTKESKDNSLRQNNLNYTEGGNFVVNKNNFKKNFQSINATATVSNATNYSKELSATQQITIPTTVSQAAVKEPFNLVDGQQQAMDKLPVVTTGTSQDAKMDAQNTQNTEGGLFSAKRVVFDFENLNIFKVKNIALPVRSLFNPCATGNGDGCPTFKRKRGAGKSFYVDIYGAPEYAFRRLAQNLPETGDYLKARDTVEKPWYAFSTGVRASLVFKNGLAFRTGVAYAQNNEIAVFDSLGVGEKTVTVKETYIPRAGGGVDTVKVTTTKIVNGIFRKTHYNRYRSIDIPLQVGFEFPMLRKI